jgi:hypothetical protein
MTILVSETFCNATKRAQFGETEPYEPWTDDVGKLFADYRREFGRAGKVYVDTMHGAQHVGWCFRKRMKYEDARDNSDESYYDREVWVTLYESCAIDDPQAVVTRHRDGAETRHPYRDLDIEAHRRAVRKAA